MQDIHDIQTHFQKFKTDLADLALQLGEAQSDITIKGLIPNRTLVEQIEKFLVNFQVFRAELRSEASDLGLKPAGPLANPESIGDLEEVLSLCLGEISRREDAISEAVAKVEQVLTLNHVDEADFTPMQAMRLEAIVLLEKFKETPDFEKSSLILEEAGAVLAFHELCSSWDKIDDHHCEELRNKVSLRFSNALAMAAIRGKIQFGPAPVKAPEPADEFVEIPNPPAEESSAAVGPLPAAEPEVPAVPSSSPFPWQK